MVERRARRADARRERVDVPRLGMVVVDHEPRRRGRPAREGRVHAIERRGGRRRRILRIERQHDDPGRSRGTQSVECVADRWIAVGHSHRDRGRLGLVRREPPFERARQRLRARQQRRTRRCPDLPVGMGAACRPERQDEGAQDDLPRNPRQVHDAGVGQEFREEAAHGLRRRRVRRAEVDDEDAGRGGHGAKIPQAPCVRYEGGGQEKSGREEAPRPPVSKRGLQKLARTYARIADVSSPSWYSAPSAQVLLKWKRPPTYRPVASPPSLKSV